MFLGPNGQPVLFDPMSGPSHAQVPGQQMTAPPQQYQQLQPPAQLPAQSPLAPQSYPQPLAAQPVPAMTPNGAPLHLIDFVITQAAAQGLDTAALMPAVTALKLLLAALPIVSYTTLGSALVLNFAGGKQATLPLSQGQLSQGMGLPSIYAGGANVFSR